MEKDYSMEIEDLQKQMKEMHSMLQHFMPSNHCENMPDESFKRIHPAYNMHLDSRLNDKMDEMNSLTKQNNCSGLVTYLGVYSSGNCQSNWIRNNVNIDNYLTLIENHTAEKVLNCIGNNARLSILLAILRRPMSVTELVSACNLNTTGQAYHHMKPLLAADLIIEDEHNKGIYLVQPHKVQGIIMLLAGISDMVDETYTKGIWDEQE